MSRQSDVLSPSDHEVLSHVLVLRSDLEQTSASISELWNILPAPVIQDSTIVGDLRLVKAQVVNAQKTVADLINLTIALLHKRRRQIVLDCLSGVISQ